MVPIAREKRLKIAFVNTGWATAAFKDVCGFIEAFGYNHPQLCSSSYFIGWTP